MIHWHGFRPDQITDAAALLRHKMRQTACSDCPKPAGCKASEKMLKQRERLRLESFTKATYDPREDK